MLAATAHLVNRDDEYNWSYAATCLAGLVLFLSLAALYAADSLASSVVALRWHVVGVLAVMPPIVWMFERMARRPGSKREMIALVAGTAVLFAINLVSPASLHFDSIVAATPVASRGGIQMYYVGRGGWLPAAYHIWYLFPVWLTLLNGVHLWRHGERALGVAALATTTTFFLADVIGALVDFQGGQPAYTGGVLMIIFVIMALGSALGLAQRRQRRALLEVDAELRATNVQLQEEMERRARLEQRLAETQRMEALGRMAAGVAHDFNNVLTVVGGHAEMIRHRFPPESVTCQSTEAIASAVSRGAGLTRQLLAFARRQDLTPTALDADRALGEMRDMLAQVTGIHSTLELELEAGDHPILADPTQFSQVIMNLVVNARDAMPEGGRLTISTAWVEPGALVHCACEGALDRGHVLISVIDTGSGIEPDTLPRIFEPFFTTKGPDRGTGLGLATVHGIVRQSGGRVSVASRYGAGTTFMICWPGARARRGVVDITRAAGEVVRLP